MKKILFLFLFSSTLGFSQGLILTTPEERKSYPKYKTDDFGFADLLPFKSSLKKHVPEIEFQDGGTCVGFASFYYGLSIMYNSKFEITSEEGKIAHSFDPYFIYSFLNNEANNCDSGMRFKEAFEISKMIGAKKEHFPPFTQCDTKWSDDSIDSVYSYTKPYAIKSWTEIDKNDYTTKDLIEIIKGKIHNDKTPIIGGFSYVESMSWYSPENLLGVKSDGLWDPRSYEQIKGGHAMCVIAYDDYKFGGSFMIANSYGQDYGDKGFLWVSYDDFIEFVEEIYFIELSDNLVELPPVVIDEENYKRFDFGNSDNLTFEGQYIDESINGYGILSFKEDDTYFIGKYVDGKREGYFRIIDRDGKFYNTYENDQSSDEMGFGSDEDSSNELQEYTNRLFNNKLNLRKSTSGRSTTSKRKK